jgi:pimeloyl-ACP methyl ester carboxylesterase
MLVKKSAKPKSLPRKVVPVLFFCSFWLNGQVTPAASSVVAAGDKNQLQHQHVSFKTEDGAIIYADLYGAGDRGVVLAHGGQFDKESWKPQAEILARAGFRILAFDFRGFGQSRGPGDAHLFTAPLKLDVLAAVRYLKQSGAKSVSVIGASFGGAAAADASTASQAGEIDRLILLAAEPTVPAEKIKSPLLFIVARDDTSGSGPRLPRIRAWFENAPQPKKLLLLNGSAHAQFLFETDQGELVMREILAFLAITRTP